MDKSNMIDDLVSRIDEFMRSGGGSMTVKGKGNEIHEEKSKCNDCDGDNMACKTPTLHEGLDREE